MLCVMLEILLAKEGCALGQVSDWNVGLDVLAFKRYDVVGRAIRGISRHVARQQFPAETGAKDEVAHGLVVYHFRRSHQHLENDSRFI